GGEVLSRAAVHLVPQLDSRPLPRRQRQHVAKACLVDGRRVVRRQWRREPRLPQPRNGPPRENQQPVGSHLVPVPVARPPRGLTPSPPGANAESRGRSP